MLPSSLCEQLVSCCNTWSLMGPNLLSSSPWLLVVSLDSTTSSSQAWLRDHGFAFHLVLFWFFYFAMTRKGSTRGRPPRFVIAAPCCSDSCHPPIMVGSPALSGVDRKPNRKLPGISLAAATVPTGLGLFWAFSWCVSSSLMTTRGEAGCGHQRSNEITPTRRQGVAKSTCTRESPPSLPLSTPSFFLFTLLHCWFMPSP